LDGVIMPAGEGYNAGMVSPNNVAFNFDQYDRTAYISSSSAFNLYSAYLTAQVVNGMQVEVQGFVGTHLTYDNTYTLSASGPTLVNFNYNGIDQAKFIPVDPVTIFVMDNLTVDVPEPSTYTLMSVASALSGFFVRRTKIQVGEPQLNPLVPDALATLTRS
jgi:hypothetical protein